MKNFKTLLVACLFFYSCIAQEILYGTTGLPLIGCFKFVSRFSGYELAQIERTSIELYDGLENRMDTVWCLAKLDDGTFIIENKEFKDLLSQSLDHPDDAYGNPQKDIYDTSIWILEQVSFGIYRIRNKYSKEYLVQDNFDLKRVCFTSDEAEATYWITVKSLGDF